MFVNLSTISFSEASKFLDVTFSKYNVLQFTFVSPYLFYDSFLSDLFQLVKSKCHLMLIQEAGADCVKVTFVISVNPFNFFRFLKLKTKLLTKKLGKEVYIYE